MEISVRLARPSDLDRLADIERDAFETLREAGAVDGHDYAPNPEEMRGWLEAGILLVAVGDHEQAVGYVGAVTWDGWLHISELDVARAWQRQGVGRRLMLEMLEEGRRRGLSKATLTTDRHAPFNAPFYRSLGFVEVIEEDLSDVLRMTLANEAAHGLDLARRVAMELVF